MAEQNFSEKRRDPRVENSLSIKLSSPQVDIVTETKNLSSSGVYCKVDRYLEPMTRLGIILLLPQRRNSRVTTRKVSCGGVVVRTENIPDGAGFNIAVFFNDISAKDSKVLADFVRMAITGRQERAS